MTFDEVRIEMDSFISFLQEKNEAYGSSFAKSGEFLRLLFPDGIPPEKLQDALTFVRIFDKMMRIATLESAFQEDPVRDIMGYAILYWKLKQEMKQVDTAENIASPAKTNPESAFDLAEAIRKIHDRVLGLPQQPEPLTPRHKRGPWGQDQPWDAPNVPNNNPVVMMYGMPPTLTTTVSTSIKPSEN
jgi:hypothetical protein